MTRLWDKGSPLDAARVALHCGRRPRARQPSRGLRRARLDRACRNAARVRLARGGRPDSDSRRTDRHRASTCAWRMVGHARPGGRPDRAGNIADAKDRRGRRAAARGPVAQRSGARGVAPVPARRDRSARRRRARCRRSARRSRRDAGRDPLARLHAHAAGDAEFGRVSGRKGLPPKSATTSSRCGTRTGAS